MVEIITTVHSVQQAEQLLQLGVDTLYLGENNFGLRLPTSFSLCEIEHITEMAHQNNKQVCIAVNAIMHNQDIEQITPFLQFLEKIQVDVITVGDPGVIHLMKKLKIHVPFIYDAQTLVTSAKQINFWVNRGAVGAVLARELTYEELLAIKKQVTVPTEILVYGPTCIHHSKRPLLQNYFNFTQQEQHDADKKHLFISEAKKPETHYTIFEDQHGTYIFANNDINLLPYVEQLYAANIQPWKLDGLFVPEETFIKIVQIFIEARKALRDNSWSDQLIDQLQQKLLTYHPADRGLDAGFFIKDANEIK